MKRFFNLLVIVMAVSLLCSCDKTTNVVFELDFNTYNEESNYYFGGEVDGEPIALHVIPEDSIKEIDDKIVYRLTTYNSGHGPDFMLRIEYTNDKTEGRLYSKCVYWDDGKGIIGGNVRVQEKERSIGKKQIEAFEQAVSQDKFWEIEPSAGGDDGVDILLEGNDNGRYRARYYFDGIGIENIHKTLFDMEKKWIIKKFSDDEGVTKDQVKDVKNRFWPLYGIPAN